jgi:hypothetical protein
MLRMKHLGVFPIRDQCNQIALKLNCLPGVLRASSSRIQRPVAVEAADNLRPSQLMIAAERRTEPIGVRIGLPLLSCSRYFATFDPVTSNHGTYTHRVASETSVPFSAPGHCDGLPLGSGGNARGELP